MDSFYGGRQGTSIAIKAAFPSIDAMADSLSKSDYKQVWYGEYCIIDTENKNDKDNGKLYRRTLKKTFNDGADSLDPHGEYYEYIGRIVGPAGPVPILHTIKGVDDINTSFNNPENENRSVYFQDGQDDEFKAGLKKDFSGSFLKTYSSNGEGINWISGDTKYGNDYVSDIKYNWYTVKVSGDKEDNYYIKIGFDIPYYVAKFTATQVAPNQGASTTETTTAPFYKEYQINIPKGHRGGWFSNIRKVTPTQTTTYYTTEAIKYSVDGDENNNLDEDSYSLDNNKTITIEKDKEIWLADFNYYEGTNTAVTQKQNIYLGQIKEIKNANLNEDGTFSINWNNGDTSTWNIGVRQGLYVDGTGSSVDISDKTPTEAKQAIQDALNDATEYEEPKRAHAIQITDSQGTYVEVYYYNSKINPAKWESLGRLGELNPISFRTTNFDRTVVFSPVWK